MNGGEVLERILERRNERIGDIQRHEGLNLEGIVDGENHGGRPRLQYINRLIEYQEYSLYQVLKKKKASDRDARKSLKTNREFVNYRERKCLKSKFEISVCVYYL